MLLSRLRPNKKKKETPTIRKTEYKIAELDEFLIKKDYIGAISLLQFKQSKEKSDSNSYWLGHCYFRAGLYEKASNVYQEMLRDNPSNLEVNTLLGCCYFYMGMYAEAKHCAELDRPGNLRNRLLFHAYHKLRDEKNLMSHHHQLGDTLEDELSLASIHYMRMHFNAAIDVYKKILSSKPNLIALNVYMAMCYYRTEFLEVAQDVLAVYLKAFPDSPAALNVKACINFKAYSGKTVEHEVEALLRTKLYPSVRELLRHNLVVFRNGDEALQVLPALVGTIPEARINLILYHLRQGSYDAALNEAEGMVPFVPTEYMVKAITLTMHAQKYPSDDKSAERLSMAKELFCAVGESTAECDTIPGRQCMASGYFLAGRFDEVLIYLDSIKEYHEKNDTFSLNFGQAFIMCNKFAQAEEELLKVTGPERDKSLYKFLMAKIFIKNGKPHYAWDIYTKSQDQKDSTTLLKMIANDCYQSADYFFAAKAFDQLEKMDPSPENWNGKRGATSGLFKLLIEGKAPPDQMGEILKLVDTSHHSQAEFLSSTIRKWAHARQMNLEF